MLYNNIIVVNATCYTCIDKIKSHTAIVIYHSRPKIAIDNDTGEGTVGSIVNYFKIGLDQSEFDSARELALQAMKQGLNLSELASNFRLRNFIKTSGASEDQIESFITNVSSIELPPEKAIELVNQIYEISRGESISPDQLPNYIKQKLEEKQKLRSKSKKVVAVNQAAEMYSLTTSAAALHVIDFIKDNNKEVIERRIV
jgi:hypothetical protein